METAEKVTLNPATFENVSKMLKSSDRETSVLALTALEEMDFNKSKMYMVLLYKASTEKRDLWQTSCPGVVKNIEALKLDDNMSFKSIYKTLKDDVSEDEMRTYLTRFEKMLTKLLTDWGFKGMVEDLNITITLKDGKQK